MSGGLSQPLLVGTVGIVVLFVARLLLNAFTTPLRSIPGPWHTRFSNLRLKFAVITGNRIHYIHDLHKQYGPIVRISPREVAINDPEAHRQIHRVGSGFRKSSWYQELNAAERPGIFAMNDFKQHAARRKLFARAFSKTFLRQNWEPVVLTKARLAVTRMKEEALKDGLTDAMKWWMFLATDVATHLMFGESFETLEGGQKSRYNHILENVLLGGGIGSELPWLRAILQKIPNATVQEIFNGDHLLKDYAQTAVRNSKQLGSATNIFANMIGEAEKGEQLDDLDVMLEASNLIVAGSDTTGITLTYLIYAVLKAPTLQRALEMEVAELPDTLSDQNLEQLPLLNAVIKETLRLYGAAPGGLPRIVPARGATLCGHYVAEGITATTQAWSMHRIASVFSDPERFDPYRWLEPRIHEMPEIAKQAFSPFGTGSRTCLGIHLAEMELRLGTALFFRELKGARLASRTTEQSMAIQNHFLIAPVSHQCFITLDQ